MPRFTDCIAGCLKVSRRQYEINRADFICPPSAEGGNSRVMLDKLIGIQHPEKINLLYKIKDKIKRLFL